MKSLLQIDFPYNGPFGEDMTKAMDDLAKDIATENGFLWKIWTENKEKNIAGGIYLFENENDAKRYLDKHIKRLESFGISEIRGEFFHINEPLSAIDNFKF